MIVFIKKNCFIKNPDIEEEYYLSNGFEKVELDKKYADCVYDDFNEDLTFSVEKYNARKQKEKDNKRIAEIKPRLEQLSQDIIQSLAGAEFEDMAERQKEFQTLHNELRILLGKEPRKYLRETE